MNLAPDDWRAALGLASGETPVAVILEGTWWEREAYAARTARLSDVRELNFPGWMLGRHRGIPIVYACAYGAPKAVEPVHVLAQVGTRLAIQIGSCGGLQPELATGDIVVPSRAEIGEGASPAYGRHDVSLASGPWVERATAAVHDRGVPVHDGHHLTTSALLQQPPDTVARWHAAGYTSVDMETSAVYTVAAAFGIDAVALLFVWDELLAGRGFLATFDEAETARQRRANEVTFDVALDLVEMVA
jgi:purine-nucleoside phosphorylase